MIFRPDGKALLDIARQTLVEQVLPAAVGGARYEGLMVANALGIVQRELDAEPQRVRQQFMETACRLLDVPMPLSTDDDAFEACRRQLAHALRDGRLDLVSDEGAAVWELLASEVQARLSVDNPKAMQDFQRSRLGDRKRP